jgi:hypothetical protein
MHVVNVAVNGTKEGLEAIDDAIRDRLSAAPDDHHDEEQPTVQTMRRTETKEERRAREYGPSLRAMQAYLDATGGLDENGLAREAGVKTELIDEPTNMVFQADVGRVKMAPATKA